MKIKPTEEQRNYAWNIVKQGNSTFRRDFEDNKLAAAFYKWVGMLGEVVLADELGLERKQQTMKSDGGFDLIINDQYVDVKVQCSYKDPAKQPYGWNISATTLDYQVADEVLFLHYHKKDKVFTVIGVIKKDKIKEVATLREKGELNPTTGSPFPYSLYEVPTKALSPVAYEKKCG